MSGSEVLARASRILRGIWLPAWFLLWDYVEVAWRLAPNLDGGLATDARLYHKAASIWMAGGDPWSAVAAKYHFAGLPPTLQLFAPLTLLPESAAGALVVCACLGAGVAILRVLRLPVWWLLFPPLAQGIVVGNPHVIMLALLLANAPALAAVAAGLKVYALVPEFFLLRWRSLAAAAILFVGSIILSPDLWSSYLRTAASTSGRLMDEASGGYSVVQFPVLVPLMVVALLGLTVVDRRATGWLAVPALWPATQFFYSTMVLPIGSVWLSVALAVPSRWLTPLAIFVYAIARTTRYLLGARRARRMGGPQREGRRGDPLRAQGAAQPAATSLRRPARAPSS